MSAWVFKAGQGCEVSDALVLELGHGEPEPEVWTGLSSVEGCIPLESPVALFREISVLLWAGREPWLDSPS